MEILTKELLEDIEKNPDKQDWINISHYYKLSEEFIEKYSDKVNWYNISRYQKLSEKFIDKHADKVYWGFVSKYQKLSPEFIDKYACWMDWFNISIHQKLSEEVMNKYSNKIWWVHISIKQKLSEKFINKHFNKLNWSIISESQKLSEKFIEKYADEVNWWNISRYQKLSQEFIEKHNLIIPGTCWLYKDKEFKRKYIQENTEYEIIDDKVIAYKSCETDGYSVFNFQYKYETGKEYECHADYNICDQNSFGLSAWTKAGAIEYHPNGKLFKVEIDLDDIAAIIHNTNKIRAKKIKILSEDNL